MTARTILFLMVAAFFAASLLLIYNAYYKPVSNSGVGLPAVVDQ
ncbi:hypothetical protein [Rhizobium sp. Leaf453]|nr:hypothetical protein [Rhizobium sp. Leaf453]